MKVRSLVSFNKKNLIEISMKRCLKALYTVLVTSDYSDYSRL